MSIELVVFLLVIHLFVISPNNVNVSNLSQVEFILQAEIERLRKEGSKQLEEEIELIRQQVQQEKFGCSEAADPSLYRLKVNWKSIHSESPSSETYNHESLNKIFTKVYTYEL